MSDLKLLKPGLLVSVKSSIDGGVRYERNDLEAREDFVEVEMDLGNPEATLEVSVTDVSPKLTVIGDIGDGSGVLKGDDLEAFQKAQRERREIVKWETTRVTADKDEHDRAVKARSAALSAIRRVCSATSFGLLCPIEKEVELNAAIGAARQIVREFNETAKHGRVSVGVLKGRIAETDEEATRSIAAEITSLLTDMDRGIRKLDVAAIRKAANDARAIGQMLDEDQGEKVGSAIAEARKAARTIAKRVDKNGEDGAKVLYDLQTENLRTARFAFLDLSEDAKVEGEALSGVGTQRFAAVAEENAQTELTPEDVDTVKGQEPGRFTRQIQFEDDLDEPADIPEPVRPVTGRFQGGIDLGDEEGA